MSIIRLSDIRENDVHENAGMSNIPWEYERGFQKEAAVMDESHEILEDLFGFDADSHSDDLLDGLSPDACGTFNTNVYVRRKDGSVRVVRYNRLDLIKLANKILMAAAEDIAFAVQRETLLPGPYLHVDYEMCPSAGETKALVIDGEPYPLRQLLSLQGDRGGVGELNWVDPDPEEILTG